MTTLEQRILDFINQKNQIQELSNAGEDFDYAIPMDMMEEAVSIFRELQQNLWQPIETAPTDGTVILAVGSVIPKYFPITVSYRSFHQNAKGKECFRDVNGYKVDYIDYWTPLPKPLKH
jgi:hypothetical protein